MRKSIVTFSRNTRLAAKFDICSILQLRNSENPGKHLGVPLLIGQNKKQVFFDLVDKVKHRIEGWKAKLLSQARRTVLIKAVASALPAFTMSHFLLPKSLCLHLDTLFMRFWWGFKDGK